MVVARALQELDPAGGHDGRRQPRGGRGRGRVLLPGDQRVRAEPAAQPAASGAACSARYAAAPRAACSQVSSAGRA
jgi:hypothetical protein